MVHPKLERARRIRDSNFVLISIFLATVITFVPFVALVTTRAFHPNETLLTLFWWTGTVILSAYGVIHLLAALADTKQFLDDYGTEYASEAAVFCHAMGQRLLVLVTVGMALVLLTFLGTGTGAPFALLIGLGLFGAILLGPPTAIPMNRRVSERLSDYRDG